MKPVLQRPGSAHPSLVTEASQACANTSVDASKAYHATGEWGKRGMTFQELMSAFDAFNEAEERVAISFAWSEDFYRKLEEPLKGVKTVFSDLDGLRPLYTASDPSPSSSSSSSTTPISSYQPSTLRQTFVSRPSDGTRRATQTPEIVSPYSDGKDCGISGHALRVDAKVDEDTIKPSRKRRRSLSVISPPEALLPEEEPTYDIQSEEGAEDMPARPPSRLGFFDQEIGEDETSRHWF